MDANTEDTYYQAFMSRDAKFDGKFFIGVKTTGVYCRPICPAKPKRENVTFFLTRASNCFCILYLIVFLILSKITCVFVSPLGIFFSAFLIFFLN